ncbi:hypothetical protein GCM10007049_10200 [Echinicola pacifica]|uniref:Outer membrane protein beta-barrel domain-containing protein n=1 Tax=Echinicola pacifica TaxID=346377 RepID=A0A918PSD2_9BACT|nr:hypothetical protein [Echinicola pacifica]GGZ19670.1 hypothetical protein GCM10007049_10200 [Echinicola pacifica]
MKKILVLAISLFLLIGLKQGMAQQAEGSYLISGGFDLARTDAPGVIKRYQIGLEANYFHWHNISFSGGYEFNYNRGNQLTLGGRYYPLEPAFLRLRGLVGDESDIALGAGYTVNISYRVRLEGMVDYYAVSNVAGLRAGLSFLIN